MRLTKEREKFIREYWDGFGTSAERAQTIELLAEIDALRDQLDKAGEAFHWQNEMRIRAEHEADRYREALERIVAVDQNEFLYPQGPAIAKEALK